MNYIPLTKETIDEAGNKIISCSIYGTEECRNIHNSAGCGNCPMFSAVLTQLHTYEEIYMEGEENKDVNLQ